MKYGLTKEWAIMLKFISLCRQRLNDTFIQNWRARLENSTRALFL